jgi:hypothetical protein
MHTQNIIPNKKRVASGKDFSFLANQFKSLVLQESNTLYTPKSTLSALNVLIDYGSVHDEIYPSQTTIAERIGVCRQTVSQSFRILSIHGIIEEKKQRGYDDSCLYKLSPLLYQFKSYLVDILPALKKCLGLTDLTDPFAYYKNTTLSMNNKEDGNKVTSFEHSAWYHPHESSSSLHEVVLTQEISAIFGGESSQTSLSGSPSSPFIYKPVGSTVNQCVMVNEEIGGPLDSPRLKEPFLFEATVSHFTKMLQDFENDWK